MNLEELMAMRRLMREALVAASEEAGISPQEVAQAAARWDFEWGKKTPHVHAEAFAAFGRKMYEAGQLHAKVTKE